MRDHHAGLGVKATLRFRTTFPRKVGIAQGELHRARGIEESVPLMPHDDLVRGSVLIALFFARDAHLTTKFIPRGGECVGGGYREPPDWLIERFAIWRAQRKTTIYAKIA